ncbi:hypothetical protein Q0Z83_025370 [Actinoplanes sichuanensis]|uniref:Uncharacterized protein n=1 Tax=Actinoplanes sichuanensis TaxID=512349 RepID=A0ABW4A0M3_9ACTN|nr:hypothetical protein [Actinoplanes sichuanensis]BEL04346.1 hypothetical protein Q0Z83_025370 [Actinoplanes sichuanensis]
MPAFADDGSDDLLRPAVVNRFYGPVEAGGATFGTVQALHDRPAPAAIQGRVDPREIAAVTDRYVEPPLFQQAAQRLERDHLVVLRGPVGLGKGASAIALLNDVGVHEQYRLLPIVGLAELLKRRFEQHHGYLVVDWEPGEPETESFWLALRTRVAGFEAHLVISTSAPGLTGDHELVARMAWEPPDRRRLILAHYRNADAEIVDRLLLELPADAAVADITAATSRIAAGVPITLAVSGVRTGAGEAIAHWWNRATPAERLEVVALAFLDGASQRTFEAALSRLHGQIKPLWTGVDESSNVLVLRTRRDRVSGDSLIQAHPDPIAGERRLRLCFASPDVARRILAELAGQSQPALWRALRDWLEGELAIDTIGPVSAGLAALATVDLDEVEHSYLEPWSTAADHPLRQDAAAHVLARMCDDSRLHNAALQTVRSWVTAGSLAQRRTAAFCLGGLMGRLYPMEAIRLLWALVERGPADVAADALGRLFGALVASRSAAHLVLRKLRQELTEHNRFTGDENMRARTLDVALRILSLPDDDGLHPHIATMLFRDADRVELAADVWHGVRANSTTRSRASKALHRTVVALDRLGGMQTSTALLDALARGAEDRERLNHDLEITARRAGDPYRPRVAALVPAQPTLPSTLPPGASED